MGLTCLEVIERTQSELLRSGGSNMPAWGTVPLALADTTTKTFTVDTRVTVPKDSVLEWDDSTMELDLVQAVSGNDVTVYERGYLESTAGTHAAGTRFIIDNPYPKVLLFNALKSLIANLYGFGIYRRTLTTSLTYSSISPVVLNALDKDVLPIIWYRSGLTWHRLMKGTHWEVIHEASPKEIQFFGGAAHGSALRIATKRDFTAPAAVTDNLTTLGVPDELQPHLPLGVAAYVLLGREVTQVQAEHIRNALANQQVPVGSRASIGNALERAFLSHLANERNRQQGQTRTEIVNA